MSQRILTHLKKADAILGAVIEAHGPCNLTAQLDCEPFEALARAIAHQQLHANAARNILQRFVGSCGEGLFPTPQRLLATPDAMLRAAGFSFAKIAALKDLAGKTVAGVIPDRQTLTGLDDARIIERLTQVRGIGRWTVEMLLIFQLGRPDVLPVDDFGIRNGFRLAYGLRKMPLPKALAAYGERWAPHRTVAAWYLWRANEMKRDGTLPAPLERIRLPRVAGVRRRVKRAGPRIKQARQRARTAARLRKASPPRARK
ncbi:MAG TPA: hypothetical protein VLX90_17685 [Steroidobacteraceae bacterium]|nr:hypothetical protein [Steroidobacteraceae bacterium]